MGLIRNVRGTRDLAGEALVVARHVAASAAAVAERWGCEPVETPVMEHAALFERSLGDGSDVVSKELFRVARTEEEMTQQGHGAGRSSSSSSSSKQDGMVLRPEGTAGVVRAMLGGVLGQPLPTKGSVELAQMPVHGVHYAGPMFRYERPQAGRQRQFHQIGVELVGGGGLGPAAAHIDVDAILMASAVLQAIGVPADAHELQVNSLGDASTRETYVTELASFCQSHESKLSRRSQDRLARGHVLRILDSKDPADIALMEQAPALDAFLSPASQHAMSTVQRMLDAHAVPYTVNPRLVRGLDYYTGTTFEFVSTLPDAGAQATLLAGGRYDGLFAMLSQGRHPIPAVGWAGGVERIASSVPRDLVDELVRTQQARRAAVVVVAIAEPTTNKGNGNGNANANADGTSTEQHAVLAAAAHTANTLRRLGVHVRFSHQAGRAAKQLRGASRAGAAFACIVGGDELASGKVLVKDMASGEQTLVAVEDLHAFATQHNLISQ